MSLIRKMKRKGFNKTTCCGHQMQKIPSQFYARCDTCGKIKRLPYNSELLKEVRR